MCPKTRPVRSWVTTPRQLPPPTTSRSTASGRWRTASSAPQDLRATHLLTHHTGAQHLAAVRDRRQPRGAIHRWTKRSHRSVPGSHRVHAHPHEQRTCPPSFRRQILLRADRRARPRRLLLRTPRGTRHPWSSRHDHGATRSRSPHDLVVTRQRRLHRSPGISSHRRVEPSRSVNKNVTVPNGNSPTRTPLTDPARAASQSDRPEHRHPSGEAHITTPSSGRTGRTEPAICIPTQTSRSALYARAIW